MTSIYNSSVMKVLHLKNYVLKSIKGGFECVFFFQISVHTHFSEMFLKQFSFPCRFVLIRVIENTLNTLYIAIV